MNENKKEFIAKVAKIQNELKVPKDKGGASKKLNYSYRSLEDIFEKIKPLLKAENLLLALTDEVREVGGRIYIVATARVYDESGNEIKGEAWAREDEGGRFMSVAQMSGATSSYARKNALCGLFLLDDNRDIDDGEFQKHTQSQPAKISAVSAKNDKELKMLKLKREIADDLISRGIDRDCLVEFFAFVGVNKDDYASLQALHSEQIGDLNELVIRFNKHKGGQLI